MHLRKPASAWPVRVPGQERPEAYRARGAKRPGGVAGRKFVPVISFREVLLARCGGVPLPRRACGFVLRAPSCGLLPKERPARGSLRRKAAKRIELRIVS